MKKKFYEITIPLTIEPFTIEIECDEVENKGSAINIARIELEKTNLWNLVKEGKVKIKEIEIEVDDIPIQTVEIGTIKDIFKTEIRRKKDE